jgi:hypothetical protein
MLAFEMNPAACLADHLPFRRPVDTPGAHKWHKIRGKNVACGRGWKWKKKTRRGKRCAVWMVG